MQPITDTPTSRATTLIVAALVAMTLALAGGTYFAAQSNKFAVPTPVIGAAPESLTRSTSATFTFTDALAGVSFQCALDGAGFSACTSLTSYAGLSAGDHRFQVRARTSRGEESASAVHEWTIDTTPPPAPALTAKPAADTNQTNAELSFTDSERRVSFTCQLDGGALAACSSPKRYAGPLGEGSHSFTVRAVDRAGNVSAATSYTWTVDTTPPPAPVLDSGPTDPTSDTTATFGFTDPEAGVAFRCRLDDRPFSGCASPKTYTDLHPGTHTVGIQAVDAAGNVSQTRSWSWTVQERVGDVTLDGNLSPLLHPGATAALDVRITNPHHFDIDVAQLTVTVRQRTTRNGQPNPACDGSVNLTVARQYGGPSRLRVPRDRSLSLSEAGVPQSQWPQLRMPDLPVNQDACKDTTFMFDYAATATKANR